MQKLMQREALDIVYDSRTPVLFWQNRKDKKFYLFYGELESFVNASPPKPQEQKSDDNDGESFPKLTKIAKTAQNIALALLVLSFLLTASPAVLIILVVILIVCLGALVYFNKDVDFSDVKSFDPVAIMSMFRDAPAPLRPFNFRRSAVFSISERDAHFLEYMEDFNPAQLDDLARALFNANQSQDSWSREFFDGKLKESGFLGDSNAKV